MIRIALIAPTPALRLGLRSLLLPATAETHAPSEVVVSDAASPADYAAADIEADVLVLAEGGANIGALRSCLPEDGLLSVVALSDDFADASALAALPLRGWAILPTDASAEEIQAGVRAAAEGLVAGSPALFSSMFQRRTAAMPTGYNFSSETGELSGVESLTDREAQVLQLVARGLANKQIALALGISEHTVKFHISSIYGKLRVTNRTEAVRAGLQLGLVTL